MDRCMAGSLGCSQVDGRQSVTRNSLHHHLQLLTSALQAD